MAMKGLLRDFKFQSKRPKQPIPMSRRAALKSGLALFGCYTVGRVLSEDASAFFPPTDKDQPYVPLRFTFASFRSPKMEHYADPLPVPPRWNPSGRTISMKESLHKFHRDMPAVPSWGYGGMSHLGPTLEVTRGQKGAITFANELGRHPMARDIDLSLHGAQELDKTMPRTVVHLHGAPNRPEHDGHPHAVFWPGEKVTYEFNNDVEATTLWYHDHAMAITRLNVYAGLAGQYWVRDEYDTGKHDNPISLPAGEYEIPLTMSDKIFYNDPPSSKSKANANNRHGHLRYQGSWTVPSDSWGGGLVGDRMVVNGKVWPYLNVHKGVYRFRLLNASQLSDYRIQLSSDAPFWVIGSDGGLLDEPAWVEALDISPGERFDILIDFSKLEAGTTVELINSMRISWAGQMIGAELEPEVMQFRVGPDYGRYQTIPKKLRGAPQLPPTLPPYSMPSEIDNVRSLAMGTTLTLDRGIESVLSFLITLQNNMRWTDPGYEEPSQGTTEYWDFVNADVLGQLHAMHIHLVQFRVVGRFNYDLFKMLIDNPIGPHGERWAPDARPYFSGEMIPPAPYELGWKDTVRSPPFQVTRVEVKWPTKEELGFDPDEIFKKPDGGLERGYVWHCHVLDHEDNEMMHRLRVRDSEAPEDWWEPIEPSWC